MTQCYEVLKRQSNELETDFFFPSGCVDVHPGLYIYCCVGELMDFRKRLFCLGLWRMSWLVLIEMFLHILGFLALWNFAAGSLWRAWAAVIEDHCNVQLQWENSWSVPCAGLVTLRDPSATFSIGKLKNVVVDLPSAGKCFLVSAFMWL